MEPYLLETGPSEVSELAQVIKAHKPPDNVAQAATIAESLSTLLDGWEEFDGEGRSVVRAAVAYFVDLDDVVPDNQPGGLSDDALVVEAAIGAVSA